MNDNEKKEQPKPYASRDELLLAEAAATASLQIIRDLYQEALVDVPYEGQTKDHFYGVLNKYAKQVQDEFDEHDQRSRLDIIPEETPKDAEEKAGALVEGVAARLNAVKAKEAQEYLDALDIRDRVHALHANGIDRHREAYFTACNVINKYEAKQAGGLK